MPFGSLITYLIVSGPRRYPRLTFFSITIYTIHSQLTRDSNFLTRDSKHTQRDFFRINLPVAAPRT